MISKYPCGSRDTEQFFWQWHFCLVCMWFSQLSMYLQTTDTAGTIDSVSQWPGEPTTCWLSETDDYDERIRMTDGFFMQQNLKQRRTHPSSVSIWRTNTNDKRHLGQQDFSYCVRIKCNTYAGRGGLKMWKLMHRDGVVLVDANVKDTASTRLLKNWWVENRDPCSHHIQINM